jgi:hypothetical protein
VNRIFRNVERLGFLPGGESDYLKALRGEYLTKEKGLLLQFQSALDEVERDTLAKAIEKLRRDYKSKVANAKWNLYFG